MNRIVWGLIGLWLILFSLMVWRVSAADRWGYAMAIALIAWLGGLVSALLIQFYIEELERRRERSRA